MKKIIFVLSCLLFFLGCIFLYQNIIYNDKKLHIITCDVGQGDAILIRTPQKTDILIDGGPDDSVLSCLGKYLPFWDRTIEIVILTHPHADHLIGLIAVAKSYKILSFGTEKIENPTNSYLELEKQLEKNGTTQRFLLSGDRFVLKDGVILKTLWPTQDFILQNPASEKKSDVNGFSIIELLTYKNFKALFTGDAQAEIIQKTNLEKVDLLKIPHHGSKTGLSSEILSILNPKLAVISVGAKNRYGHPNPFALDLLNQSGIKTLRTDQANDIEIISSGITWKVN